MKRKVFALALAAILVALSATACTRSATTKSPETTEIAFPAGTTDPSTRLTEIIQQTNAVLPTADLPAGGGAEVQTTSIVTLPTATETPAPTATLPAIPTLERPETYTLQKGEWPICIARRYNLDVSGLLAANNLSMSSQPAQGTVLKIPTSGAWSSGKRELKAHPVDYTVASGDTIYTIACAFGDVSPEAIIAANNLASPYSLTSGQVLRIP